MHDATVWTPRRVALCAIFVTIWVIAEHPPDFPDLFVVERWVVTHDDPVTPVLLPPPHPMAHTLDDARALIPEGAFQWENVSLHPRYCEAWIT